MDNPVRDWGKIIGQFMMFFEERFGEIRTHDWGSAPKPRSFTLLFSP